MSLREIKAAARRDLHEAMRVPALYYATVVSVAVPCHVRVHSDNKALGDLKGTSFSYAEKEELVPALVFWRSEPPGDPVRNSVVMISETEGYKIDHTEPPDGLTVTAKVSRLKAAELASYAAP